MPLAEAQALMGRTGQLRHILVSNRGGETSGAAATSAVVRGSAAALAPLGLELQEVKRDGLELADAQGDVFISIFTTFGSFSIAAGVLLIFLIFVMLSAERRSELGIARAIGTRREHLVQMFVFEGLAYDLGAAAVGAALGVGVAFAMVAVMADAFSTAGFEIEYAVSLRSVVVAYTLNWLLLGFMGLGLIVGVAALGVISARSVVERRQQIGVLRSIGFRRGMVQLSFLLESSLIALSAIAIGTALGLVIAYNVIQDSADQPSWQGALRFAVPWLHLGIVFLAVYAAALLTTLAPAARAARVYPAEALRYE